MRISISIIILLLFGCNNSSKQTFSFWESQKSHFKYQNKEEFVIDSILWDEFKAAKFKKIEHPLFDSIIGNPAHLYSWQDREPTKTEFTVIKDDDEHGLKIVYFILNKKDSLLSFMQIAGKGIEEAYWFETRSRFISTDSMLSLGAITQWYDYEKKQPLVNFRGDTTFSYLIIDKEGKFVEGIFKEVKALNFENRFDD